MSLKQAIVALCMVCLLGLAAAGGKYHDPPVGMHPFKSDSTSFASAAADTVIDSLRCPRGHVLSKFVLRSTRDEPQKMLIGAVHRPTATGTVADVDRWFYVHADPGGALGDYDRGRTFEFFFGAEKLYLKSGSTGGSQTRVQGAWEWDAYSVQVGPDRRDVWADPSGSHSPLQHAEAVFDLADVYTLHGEDLYFRVAHSIAADEFYIFACKDYLSANLCPSPPLANYINETWVLAYAFTADTTSTNKTVTFLPAPNHPSFPALTITYNGLGIHANDNTAVAQVWGYK